METNKDQFEMELTDFFEHKLSDEAALAFLEKVAADDALSIAFNTELYLRCGQEEEELEGQGVQFMETEDEFESAEQHLATVKNLLEAGKGKTATSRPGAKVRPMYRRATAVAAAIVALLGIGILLYLVTDKKPTGESTVKAPVIQWHFDGRDTAQLSIAGHGHDTAGNEPLARLLFDKLRKEKYTAGDEDPVEASNHLYAYEQGRYRYLVNLNNDFVTMGSGDKNERALLYAGFYKALGYIQLNKPSKALQLLLPLTKQAAQQQELHGAVLWYTGLSYLQMNDTVNAKTYWQRCSQIKQGREYPKKAANALKELAHTR
jgi:hypothetical protein